MDYPAKIKIETKTTDLGLFFAFNGTIKFMMKKIFCIAIMLVCVALPAAANTRPASLKFVSNKKDIKIIVDSGSQSINAVGIIIDFDPAKVKIKDLDFTDSFCELFIEQSIDMDKGQIRILCGKPNPGFSGVGVVGTIHLTKYYSIKRFSFNSDTQVLANDGLGTNVLRLVVKK